MIETVRVDPSDVEGVLLDGAWAEAVHDVDGKTAAGGIVVGELVLDPTAEPPFDKFLALCEAEPRFRQSWDRKRRDLKDSSPSAYDMALADYSQDYLAAHDRRWSATELECQPGTVEALLTIPPDARGPCHVRVMIAGQRQHALGSATIFIRRPSAEH